VNVSVLEEEEIQVKDKVLEDEYLGFDGHND
jgi:hypothetical protein